MHKKAAGALLIPPKKRDAPFAYVSGVLSSMNKIMTYLQSSPLYPLKGRIAVNFSRNKLATITPLRGRGVSRCDNILFP
jgi:hypothetical protein